MLSFSVATNPFVGLVVKASASRTEDPGFGLRQDFPGSSHTSDLKISTPCQWLPCQAPRVVVSVLGLVG